MQEGTRHLLKLKSTGDCPRTNNSAHLIEMPDEIEISKGRLPWCVQCGLEFSKTEAELMAIIFARAEVAAALEELRAEWQHQLHCYTARNKEEIYFERQCELEIRLRELDTTIAHLGLAPTKENT